MSVFFWLPFVFVLFYLAGAGPEAFIGATFLLVPFARKALSYGVSTPLFFLVSGVIMGRVKDNTSSLLLKEVFEISTLFLAYAASYEFTSSLRKLPFKATFKRVVIEFMVVSIPFVLYFLAIGAHFKVSLIISLLFLSISPITSMILLYETPLKEPTRQIIEGGIIVRDALQILLLLVLSHFFFHGLNSASGSTSGLLKSLLIAPMIGGFLAFGNGIEKRGSYLFLPASIVFSLILEMHFHIPSIFVMVFAGFWERVLTRKGKSAFSVIETGKIFYPFIYTYTGQLMITFSLHVFVAGAFALFIKFAFEYVAAVLSGCKFRKVDISVKIPMAGLSLHHLFSIKGEIKEFLFQLVAFVLIASEFLAPLLLSSLKNAREKI